jgi:hypothetical protein
MPIQAINNDFLLKLLELQQDGKQAISSPANWTREEPLLDVTTEVDEIIAELEESILTLGDGNDTARWHFFIGSPGNGKSAAIGKLCRHLLQQKNCKIVDPDECPIEELDASDIPYAFDVYENGKKYPSVRIVQDASVVTKPFSADADPSRELVSSVEGAWDRGISLIVCTNRGIIEKAYRDNSTERDTSRKPWFKVLSSLVNSRLDVRGSLSEPLEFQGKKAAFKKVIITFSHLDNRSLLLGSDICERVIKKAVEAQNWRSCEDCVSKESCPFKANRDWLNDDKGRKTIISVLQRAEVLSGQIFVFREALALISLILAGCARDFSNVHPCEWVKTKASGGDVFSLAVRRIYISLFSSFTPYGLECSSLRKDQVDYLKLIQKEIGRGDQGLKKSLDYVVGSPCPSTDVGLSRLLGESGVFCILDPLKESLPEDLYDRWDGDFSAINKAPTSFLSQVDLKCIEIWASLEQIIEATPAHTALKSNWALRRWSSNFLLHLGCLIEGRTLWQKELDEFIRILEAINHPPEVRTIEELRLIHDFETKLEALIDTGSTSLRSTGSIKLSEAVRLSGDWVVNNLKPRIVTNEKTSGLSLILQFGGGERASLGASMYVWLNRRANGDLDPRCFPSDLLTAAGDARIRAAAKGKYAFEDNDVELEIQAGDNEQIKLVRLAGDVDVR